MHPSELEMKDSKESFISAWNLDILFNRDTHGKITSQTHYKRDHFSFSIVNFTYSCSNIQSSPAYGLYVSKLIRCARTCSAYDQFLSRDKLLTNKL